jgi:hypothetical protein
MTQHQAGAIETVMGKARFEQWLWDQCVSEVKYYHGDNGIFSAEEYCRDCEEKGQSQSFSGLALNTKMHVLREPSNQSQTWSHPISMEMREYS